jgi:cell division cycle protein 20 (cofactor of APC complex)
MAANGDRFIPHRSSSSIELELQHAQLASAKAASALQDVMKSPKKESYKSSLAESIFDGKAGSKILACKNKAPAPKEGYQNNLRILYSKSAGTTEKAASRRVIPASAIKILDAPDVTDDFYLNLLDWSKNNLLSVALGTSVYVWNVPTGDITKLVNGEGSENPITSVSWMQEGNVLAVGGNDSVVTLYDFETQKKMRTMKGMHDSRVSALAWNRHILSSASRSGSIIHHDVRMQQHVVSRLEGHSQEVCGLKWSADGSQLASGGNDNVVKIWDLNTQGGSANCERARFTFTDHCAAVKALAWCPWSGQSNLLATGGGTADRHIRFWNTTTGACVGATDTGSQVCQLAWSKTYRELLSTHGFSQNQLCVWKYPNMRKVQEMTGHESRVLHLALSPDGATAATLAADETLRFWRVFEAPAESNNGKAAKSASIAGNGAAINMRSSLTTIR